MDDALYKSNVERCRLNMPEGLKELMSDISREVLRAQPSDLYRYIAEYLSALLVTRDNLSVAGQLCNYVCECQCHPELLNELEEIGLDEHNATIVQDVVIKYFKKEKVNEGNLLEALLAKTNIEARMYPAVVKAVRLAYLRHQAHNTNKNEVLSECEDDDDIARAVSHTLELYRKSEPTDGLYGEMATKIQAAYRAYGVRREMTPGNDQLIQLRSSVSDQDSEKAVPATPQVSTNSRVNTESSVSLAGSMCTLPRHKPYNAHDTEYLSLQEETEKEHAHIDYTARSPHVSLVSEGAKRFSTSNKRISFGETSEEELYKSVTAYKDFPSNLAVNEGTANQDQERDQNPKQILNDYDEYNTEASASFDENIPEEGVELEAFDYEENYSKAVNKSAIEYINVLNMEVDSDSGDDYESQSLV